MSRPKRELRKKFVVFCEGDTEYNYIDAMRLEQGVELALKPINMKGGGYAHFDIKITGTEITWEHENERGSNINEFFEIIDW